MPDLSFEALHPAPVCGVDEVGRGPLCGPVVAAAVILDPMHLPGGLDDSKKLTAMRRAAAFDDIMSKAWVGIGEATAEEIDTVNILQATFLAMRRAVASLTIAPAFALIDGNKVPPGLPCPADAVVKGDGRSASIAAASIIAKVHRDHFMAKLSQEYPGYGWERNAGYGTAEHLAALRRLGVTPYHRRSFAPIHKILV